MTEKLTGARSAPSELIDLLGMATRSLDETIMGFTPQAIALPCALPDWSRGHLLTHLANNAEGLTRLILGAQSGRPLSMYSSTDARNSDIESGATRPGAIIAAHAQLAAATLDAAITTVSDWETSVIFSTVKGADERSLTEVLRMRLREVAIHHVDLAADHRFDDEDPNVIIELVRDAALRFSPASDHSVELLVDGTYVATIAADRSSAELPTVDLSGAAMLGWLTGRDTPRSGLPPLPNWG